MLCMKVKKLLVAQSCMTLRTPMDCSSPDPSVHGILQARILEWIAMPFSRGSSQLLDRTRISCTVINPFLCITDLPFTEFYLH